MPGKKTRNNAVDSYIEQLEDKEREARQKRNRRIKTTLAVISVILLSAGIGAAIVFGGGIPLIPFLPLLAAAVVNPIALTAVVAGLTAVGLTILGSLTYGAVKLRQWVRGKIKQKNKSKPFILKETTHPTLVEKQQKSLLCQQIASEIQENRNAQQQAQTSGKATPIFWRPCAAKHTDTKPSFFAYQANVPINYILPQEAYQSSRGGEPVFVCAHPADNWQLPTSRQHNNISFYVEYFNRPTTPAPSPSFSASPYSFHAQPPMPGQSYTHPPTQRAGFGSSLHR